MELVNCKTKRFADIKAGQFFIYKDNLWMKVDIGEDVPNRYLAVCVSNVSQYV
jgi:hypothetical protein